MVSKPELLIRAVVIQKLSYGQVARLYGVQKSLVHRLHHRWLAEGDAAFRPRSSRPHSSPNRVPDLVRERVLELRDQLTADGLDAGADTIHSHLLSEGHQLSRATAWRILSRAGRIVPQPQKRPRSSFLRFAAERPNETWQSDFTHWTLATGTGVEIIGWLDDHSCYYNEQRPHRALNRHTPHFAYTLIDKATPTSPEDPNLWRVRYDLVDASGKVSLRHSNHMLHLGIGRAHARTEIIALIHNDHATVIDLNGTVLGEYDLDPSTNYQAKKNG